MSTLANSTVLAAIVAGAVSFITFLINRHDNRGGVLDKIQTDLADLKEEFERGRAISARIRILTASDEVIHGTRHSQEWWDQVLDDCTFYEQYCASHKNFLNKKAQHATEHLNNVYVKIYQKNDFI